jgi:hypothetical protein
MLRKLLSLGAVVVVAVTFGVSSAAAKPGSPGKPGGADTAGFSDGRCGHDNSEGFSDGRV